MTDALSEFLSVAGVRGSLISRALLKAPFGVAAGQEEWAIFHAPVRGRATIALAGGRDPMPLHPGDVAVLPRGAPHEITDSQGRRCSSIHSFEKQRSRAHLTRLTQRGVPAEETDTELYCGRFKLGEPAGKWLLDPLPDLFVVGGSGQATEFIRATLHLMEAEVAGDALGSRLVSDRLVEVLVIHLLRGWAEGQTGTGWLAGMSDPQLGPLITELHAKPSGNWSLERMAKRAGMSRTRFVERFRTKLGAAPGAWMTEWRIAVARRALREGADVASAAERSGYASEASFSRAFKRVVGQSPGAWRIATR